MLLVSITRLEKAQDKFRVLFEDGAEVKVGSAQIADFGLYTGRELSEEEYIELREGLALSAAKTRALRILGSRNMSAREVGKRLMQKGEDAETAEEAVRWLEDIGAVNDAEYASMIVRHYCAKGYGIARIRDELYRRGINREMWDDALSEMNGTEEAAYEFLERKMRGSCDKASLKRAADALYRRGFSRDEINAALHRYRESVDETEEMQI